MAIGWVFPDIGEAYGLTIRRGVAEFRRGVPENPDMTLTLDKTVLDQVLLGRVSFPGAMVRGDMKVSGNPLNLVKMFNMFEKPFVDPIRLTVR
jgi:alkyl sulfatase BDS1-like metallo-beta-lactamase superfamily hydrolase